MSACLHTSFFWAAAPAVHQSVKHVGISGLCRPRSKRGSPLPSRSFETRKVAASQGEGRGGRRRGTNPTKPIEMHTCLPVCMFVCLFVSVSAMQLRDTSAASNQMTIPSRNVSRTFFPQASRRSNHLLHPKVYTLACKLVNKLVSYLTESAKSSKARLFLSFGSYWIFIRSLVSAPMRVPDASI
jgi:hypothetical protein